MCYLDICGKAGLRRLRGHLRGKVRDYLLSLCQIGKR
ncbi:hypothetical protein TP2_09580 [Thioclava pacifica DSM 10166]|uniref:Uncharacterized protein n=1 Tax=Thioclava pacifica DSM 10166 TaxID=1353537 RepID=A0A074J5C0_9RHOB|nr:hypothetical protein TP2_09580 [Thioclava pacifica DSM 10166]